MLIASEYSIGIANTEPTQATLLGSSAT